MKVVIVLNSKQAEKVTALIEEHNKNEKANETAVINCGDVVMYNHGFGFNSDQSLRVVENTLVIEGQRCPISRDGILQIVASIDEEVKREFDRHQYKAAWEKAKKFFGTLKVTEYKTSDRKLKWYETKEQFLEDLGNEELIEELLNLPQDQFKNKVLNDVGWYDVNKMIWGIFDFQRFSYIVKVENQVKASATFTPNELKLWRKFRAVRAERIKSWGY